MKTDDRTTRQRDEVDGDEAKVVRLSDWLAPDDELVPFGPRAHARTATRQPADGAERDVDPDSDVDPSSASGFWDGDTSVHTAMPGPGIFDAPGERTAGRSRSRRPAPVWRPALPTLRRFGWAAHARDRLDDLVERVSWRWVAGGVGLVGLAVVLLVVIVIASSSDHHETAARAGIGDPSRVALSGTLDEIGFASRAVTVADLRRLPPVNPAVRTIGSSRRLARALAARHRHHAVVASAPASSSSTTESVEPPAAPASSTLSPTETTPTPTEPAPVQTPSTTTPTSGGGNSSSGGASSGSQKQSPFGATGSLGPGSSPNG